MSSIPDVFYGFVGKLLHGAPQTAFIVGGTVKAVPATDVATPAWSALASNTHSPAADTAAVVTKVAAAGARNKLASIAWSYDAVPTGGSIAVEDGAGNRVYFEYVTQAGPGTQSWNPPLQGSANTALIVTLAAGGGAVRGALSIHHKVE